MEQYISKSALMAKIKGLIRANESYLSEHETDEIRFQKVGAYSVLNDLLHFLDTLEVKEDEVKDNWEFIQDFIEKLGHFPKDSDELDVLINYVAKSKKQKFEHRKENES